MHHIRGLSTKHIGSLILPIKCSLDVSNIRYPTQPASLLDWAKGKKSLQASLYAAATDDIVRPMLGKEFDTIDELNDEIQHVCGDLANAAEQFIPKKEFKSKKKIIDKILSHLCWKSCVAYRNWNKAARPFFGPTCKDRKKCKKDVATHLNECS